MSENDEGAVTERSSWFIIFSLLVSTFFSGFGGGVVFPIFPALGTILGISPFLVGVILSANRFSRLICSAPAGAIVDRFGARTPYVLGLGIQAIATFGYIVALYVPLPEAWFLGSRIVLGAASALTFATSYTIAANVSVGDSRGMKMGLIRGGSILGFPTGLLVGGVVSDLIGMSAAFFVAAVFAVIATGLAYWTIPETHVEDGTSRSVKPWDIDTSIPTLTLGLVNFGIWFAYMGVLFASLVLFLEATGIGALGFDAQGSSGIFMALTVLSAAVSMLIGGKTSDTWDSRVPVMLVFLSLLTVGFVLLPWAESARQLAPVCVVIGTGMGGTLGPYMALLADLTPEERMGRASGTTNVFSDIGGGLGPIIALPLIESIGFVPVYTVSAGFPLFAGVALVVGLYVSTGKLFPKTGGTDSTVEAAD
ncbi:MFS transporter [Natranaeroarchaeum sulfidigenes]|uniref:MFS family permease n=1 Tax=Natranaeroarchaeum sulfidigenes TaxID=2784880 RepID=A0A897MN12_9EURY|nr:MFS transporter [Natranaeroarchaeum sulfidigenes]QSG01792.1 MFS family permease [Natranaeroarchaeum sulfidigenes]